ncbi:MAG: fused MFS/spermidine synthase [Nitrospiraceae bacterium]|nr:MAG: fused MFS/spermidine synthase [Nitrospiraceae bacterium]
MNLSSQVLEDNIVDNISHRKNIIFWCLGFSGMSALIFEIHWTREISFVIGSTTYALSTVLAAFLSGLALGAFVGGKYTGKRNPLRVFGLLQFAISISAFSVHFVHNSLSQMFEWLYYSFSDWPFVFFILQYITIFLVIIIPTSLMGAAFPFAMKAYAKDFNKVAEDAGSLYSINTIGSVIGAILCGFLLIPYLGLDNTEVFASVLNISIASLIFILLKDYKKLLFSLAVYILVIMVYFFIPLHHPFFNIYFAGRVPSQDIQNVSGDYEIIWERDDIEGKVEVARSGNPPMYGIRIKGKPEGTLKLENDPKQLLMTYLPLASRPHAHSFLKIGLGPGVTLATAAKIQSLTKLDVVEINASVIEAVQKFFYPSLFKDRRIQFIVDDARNFLSRRIVQYDIITSQPSDPTDQSSGYLFTKEYYEIVRSRLTGDGVFSQFVPYYLLGKEGTDIIVKTLSAVFPYVYGWNLDEVGSLLLISSVTPIKESADIIKARVEKYNTNLKYSFFFGAGPAQLRQVALNKNIPVNTDDKDLIEFIAARRLLCYTDC